MGALDLVASWPVPAAAAGVVRRGAGAPVVAATAGDPARPFPWASVTKLCTALAVLVAVEEGTIALEDPAGPPGATVAHLLAHASGLAPDAPVALAAPGRRRIYSNAGFELLAATVAARAQMPFGRYLSEAVLEPLGMTGATLHGSAASGLTGTLGDLLALGRELLAPSVVAPETLAHATRVAFPGLAGVLPGYGRQDPCDWGLGFELRDHKRPHWTGERCSPATFGHYGRSGAFVWVDPVAGVACAFAGDRDFGAWAVARWPALADAVLAELAPVGTGPAPAPVDA